MDSAEQASGEKRVRKMLLEPLARRGLAKPSSLTKAQFEEMCEDICERLAYMSELNLAALEEQVASNPAGKEKDRLPIGQKILDWAGVIQPPGDEASPLMRAVFASQLGLDALAGGWAPELLQELRTPPRVWPTAWIVKTVKDKADDACRQMRAFEQRLSKGGDLTATEQNWRAQRQAVLAKCQSIADLGRKGAEA